MLSKSVSSLESKVTTLQGAVDRLSRSQAQSGATVRTSATSSGTSSGNGRVSVSAKVKVEDRYVRGTTVLPKVSTGPEGVVIIGVVMDHGGDVTSARVKSETTITDEDILDACKESALKTKFSINLDVSGKHPATITYTFTAK